MLQSEMVEKLDGVIKIDDASVEVVLALVPLPPSSGLVRWIRVAQLVDAVDHHEVTRFPG